MEVEWIRCAERLPSIGHPVCWIANHEQLWGMATLSDGKPCHGDDYWWLESQQDSLAQMFVTHWAEVDWPDLPQKEGGDA